MVRLHPQRPRRSRRAVVSYLRGECGSPIALARTASRRSPTGRGGALKTRSVRVRIPRLGRTLERAAEPSWRNSIRSGLRSRAPREHEGATPSDGTSLHSTPASTKHARSRAIVAEQHTRAVLETVAPREHEGATPSDGTNWRTQEQHLASACAPGSTDPRCGRRKLVRFTHLPHACGHQRLGGHGVAKRANPPLHRRRLSNPARPAGRGARGSSRARNLGLPSQDVHGGTES